MIYAVDSLSAQNQLNPKVTGMTYPALTIPRRYDTDWIELLARTALMDSDIMTIGR
jgi:hypothetical protein